MNTVRLPSVVFEVTPECNQDCRYCYNVWKRPGESAPEPHGYRQALGTLKALFRRTEVGHIAFSGGEPFLSERFLELVLACRLRRKSVTVITNGTCASEADWCSLKEIGVGLVEVPILSFRPEVHDRLTRRKGSWRKAVASCAHLLELGVPMAAVVVLTAVNAPDLGGTLDFLKSRGVTGIMINRFNIGGGGIREWRRLSLPATELRSAFALADRKARESPGIIRISTWFPAAPSWNRGR
jgi:MoaA/NifB/PqqE/SkfB family radical SAM enzyme